MIVEPSKWMPLFYCILCKEELSTYLLLTSQGITIDPSRSTLIKGEFEIQPYCDNCIITVRGWIEANAEGTGYFLVELPKSAKEKREEKRAISL
jgi:hypothetical protein